MELYKFCYSPHLIGDCLSHVSFTSPWSTCENEIVVFLKQFYVFFVFHLWYDFFEQQTVSIHGRHLGVRGVFSLELISVVRGELLVWSLELECGVWS